MADNKNTQTAAPAQESKKSTNAASAAQARSDSDTAPKLGASAVAPEAPTFTLTPGDKQITVAVTASASDGGAAITGYPIVVNDASTPVTTLAAAGSYVIPSLTDGTAYTVKVGATNSVGTTYAADQSATPVAASAPAAPVTIVTTSPSAASQQLVACLDEFITIRSGNPTSDQIKSSLAYLIKAAQLLVENPTPPNCEAWLLTAKTYSETILSEKNALQRFAYYDPSKIALTAFCVNTFNAIVRKTKPRVSKAETLKATRSGVLATWVDAQFA